MIPATIKALTAHQSAQVADLYLRGLGISALALHFTVPFYEIRKCLDEHNIRIRSRHESRALQYAMQVDGVPLNTLVCPGGRALDKAGNPR